MDTIYFVVANIVIVYAILANRLSDRPGKQANGGLFGMK